eukprot:gnl/TRDRNA2_/TRDRNA2_132311_c1_seq1.p1 gnl/TRDRNA2_/TRDRNA2_132311_c1~~gnl/TRDRNA2_/TRDRNA2_132311_c1_seq1.p1  ORF type:complete len:253 (-),score=23.79 gnl/TRDRNA2_/TRDRNA2_132311_c1_seq1:68-793(-)
MASALLQQAGGVERLRHTGALVIRAFEEQAFLDGLAFEMEGLDKAGYFQCDTHQTCNPGALGNLLGVAGGVPDNPAPGSVKMNELLHPKFVSACPHIVEAVQLLQGLCWELQSQLPELPPLCIPCQTLLTAYPPETFYRRHLDCYSDEDNPRMLSLVLYANKTWKTEWGGQLRWWPTSLGPDPPSKASLVEPSADMATEQVSPTGGDLVVMWSRTVWHEILPVSCSLRRYAMVQWLWKTDK